MFSTVSMSTNIKNLPTKSEFIRINNQDVISNLGQINCIFLDKTGTITEEDF